ncbi:putative serine protease EDA2 [Mucuna pruriens]|uniref:Serine protease EDA2 n=1 Tax=Mucuna pruriens TaxID=157652 RepID=A0A371FHS1_MUCPR|nr:putative serine protease EDA2 [Mucuna pruriens]
MAMTIRQEDWAIVTTWSFLLFVSFPAFSYGVVPPRMLLNKLSERKSLTNQEHWFNQTLDHFSPYDHRRFQQRYYEFLDYFRIPDGPIFLVIGGEGPCNGIANDYIGVLAKKFGAALVSLEHRYYGKSSPFNSLETKNLKYLSSKQALFDLAVFRQYYQNSLNAKLNRTKIENPWFVFGGSYSGALSAWFRLKFPHLTCGSLASSAVVLAVYNYTEYDQQIGESAGAECKAVLQETTHLIEQKLATNGKELKSSFNADDLKLDGDFMYLVADAAAAAFQYGNPDKVCKPMVEAKKAGEDLVDAYAKYTKEYYIGTFGVNVLTYDQEYLKKTAINEDSSTRLWWFQVCTEVAYFQVAPSNDNTIWIFAKMSLERASFLKILGVMQPNKLHLLICLPTLSLVIIVAIVLIFEDVLKLLLSLKNCSSPDAVHKVRQKISEHMDLWLSECQAHKNYI